MVPVIDLAKTGSGFTPGFGAWSGTPPQTQGGNASSSHAPGFRAWSGTPPPNQGGISGNHFLNELDLDGDGSFSETGSESGT